MMELDFSVNGSKYISEKIKEALGINRRYAVICGNWIIDEPVRLPSDFTLVMEDCRLRLADGCYSNIFVNEHHDTALGKTSAGTDRNISVIGKGIAVLDGGEYNGLSEKTHLKNGLPPIWKNNLILFTNVKGFKITGISCKNQRWWALNFVYCSDGYIGDIDFCANDTAVDKNGKLYHGISHSRYEDILVKNADGIDLRCGCHDIVVENITGFTEDDSVALTGIRWELERYFAVEGASSDIYNIKVKNISTSAFCTNVRLLNQGDIKIYDIVIDGVCDTSENSPHMERGLYAVRIGDTSMYGSRHSTADETYNIEVKNVYSRGKYAVALAGQMKNIVIENIECAPETQLILDERNF